MNILVTGASGYIGSVLCPALLAAGHRVTALDSFRYGAQQATALAACCADPNFELVKGDVRDHRLMRDLVKKADVVIPLAALVGAPLCAANPEEAIAVNYHAVQWIAASLSPQQLLIYPNSNSGYGIGSNAECDEDSPLRPVSLYGTSKCQAEEDVLEHPNSVVLRLATVFGCSPRMRTDLLVNDFCMRAARDRFVVLFEANARRNFVHVRDVVDAFLLVIDRTVQGCGVIAEDGSPHGPVFNLGHDGANVTKRELCAKIAAQTEFYYTESAIGSDPDKRDYVVSNARLARAGFTARRTLDDGIRELLKLYRAFPQHPWGNV